MCRANGHACIVEMRDKEYCGAFTPQGIISERSARQNRLIGPFHHDTVRHRSDPQGTCNTSVLAQICGCDWCLCSVGKYLGGCGGGGGCKGPFPFCSKRLAFRRNISLGSVHVGVEKNTFSTA